MILLLIGLANWWKWLSQAVFDGIIKVKNGGYCNLWSFKDGNMQYLGCVNTSGILDIPVFMTVIDDATMTWFFCGG